MPKVKKLPPATIQKIAAGQVVERPASVVKELIENSLDAGASKIKIDIKGDDISSISVSDNGHGMSRDDLELCYLPHTTSKISTEPDLLCINTLGFRGEALASIAAAGQLSLSSKSEADTVGAEIKVSNNQASVKDLGRPTGTTVFVNSLFSTLPARKRAQRNDKTEWRHIVETVSSFALAHSEVSFELTKDGKTVLNLPARQDPLLRVGSVLGSKYQNNLLPLVENDQLKGYLGSPRLAQKNAPYYLFVNGRPVRSPELRQLVKDIFGGLIEPRFYPFFWLNLSLPFETLDVNVNPRKDTVHFLKQNELFSEIESLIKSTLEKQNPLYEISQDYGALILRDSGARTTASDLRASTQNWQVKELGENVDVLQLHQTYLIAETASGLICVDQHAAHERILYEQFLNQFKNDLVKKHDLDKPVTLELPTVEKAALNEHQEQLASFGLEIEPFGGTTYRVTAVPHILRDRDIKELIAELLRDLSSGQKISIDSESHKVVTYLACRSAVKAGESLSQEERRKLINELIKTDNRATCPHGRPTLRELNLKELNHLFKR